MSRAGSRGKLVLLGYRQKLMNVRWGGLLIVVVGVGVILIIAAVAVGWWWMTRGKKEEYEPLEGEDEE
jgi:flagellar basal body-associated protein FliL